MKSTAIKFATVMVFAVVSEHASAQLYPPGNLYFQNQYVGNPAMAGTTQGLNVNITYRKQWNNMPGSPTSQMLAADYGLNTKVGLGLIISADKAGLFKQTRTVATYAYHVPLSIQNDQKLSFGLSLGFLNGRIAEEDINGDPSDVNIGNYDLRRTYIDGDFGLAYTSGKFNMQLALPNMKASLRKDLYEGTADRVLFFSALSYKWQLSDIVNEFTIEPKAVFRGIGGHDNILDAGANLTYADRISFYGMYHTTRSLTFGLGFNYGSIDFLGMYSTSTAALNNYTNGNFQFSLLFSLPADIN